jgi:tyrosine-protein phosphatase SIW14
MPLTAQQHRTGCVVAVVRKVSGWDLSTILDEYRSYAKPKVRECDEKYIAAFELSSLSNLWIKETDSHFRIRAFLRTFLFTVVFLLVWVTTGARLTVTERSTKALG